MFFCKNCKNDCINKIDKPKILSVNLTIIDFIYEKKRNFWKGNILQQPEVFNELYNLGLNHLDNLKIEKVKRDSKSK